MLQNKQLRMLAHCVVYSTIALLKLNNLIIFNYDQKTVLRHYRFRK